ncbi:MAG: radical SAM protein [Lachnospiraceae bacterium]|nr:radical SAM protein [Lachnospiraceae bacterium]
MHYTGTIWRPPYEAASLLLEVTAGCTHHKCKFCTLYNDLPFPFRMSPMEDIVDDLQEVQKALSRWNDRKIDRVFLTGANPFVLSYDKLAAIATLIHEYLPSVSSIGCFARITDISPKTDSELAQLHAAGYDRLTIGVETGDDNALQFMNKGYGSSDILTQCQRLDAAGIRYSFFYLAGISGAGRGETGAERTAALCNCLHPITVGANMLTIYPDSALFGEIKHGNWQEESELEKYRELRTLVAQLRIETTFAAFGASNAFQMQGSLPNEQKKLLSVLDRIIETVSEEELRRYRKAVHHL